jgi:membrane protein involved in colicin uptake
MESVMVDRAAIAQMEKQLLHQRTTAIRLNDQRMLRSNSHALNLVRAQMSNKEMQDETISGLMQTVRRQQ